MAISIPTVAQGAEVVVASSTFYRDAVERHGLRFASLRPEINEKDSEIFQKGLEFEIPCKEEIWTSGHPDSGCLDIYIGHGTFDI